MKKDKTKIQIPIKNCNDLVKIKFNCTVSSNMLDCIQSKLAITNLKLFLEISILSRSLNMFNTEPFLLIVDEHVTE